MTGQPVYELDENPLTLERSYESAYTMSQTAALLLRGGKTAIEKEAEARSVDSRVLRSIIGLRQDGSEDLAFVEQAVESAVQRKLSDRFKDTASRVRWELSPFAFHDVTQVTSLTEQKKLDERSH